jgi:hypothetical protein
MDKNELADFALSELAVELDLHRPLKELKQEVKNLLEKGKTAPAAAMPNEVKYLKHPSNGRVYAATPILWRRGDMIPCDKDGTPVAVQMASEEATRDSVLRAENARLSRELAQALQGIAKLQAMVERLSADKQPAPETPQPSDDAPNDPESEVGEQEEAGNVGEPMVEGTKGRKGGKK